MREQRRALGSIQQRKAAIQLRQRILSFSGLQRSQHIAFYISNDGEPDLTRLMQVCHRAGKSIWLPCIGSDRDMAFRRHRPGARLIKNRYGIGEPPAGNTSRTGMQMDLVFMPLVAFDRKGNRLGMGGGFYDRAFSLHRRRQSRPLLLGVAHSFQQVESLPADPWDIPMAAVATETKIQLLRG